MSFCDLRLSLRWITADSERLCFFLTPSCSCSLFAAEAFACLVKASEYFTEIGRFTIAAKHFKVRARGLPET